MIIHFAHRGSLTEAPENTLPSFERALQREARAIELDVQLTKDGHLVICHDQKIDRIASEGNGGYIKDFTLEQLRQFDIGSFFSREFAGVSFALLEEVLDICPPDLLINIEIKNTPVFYPNIEKKLINCLRDYERLDPVIVSSLDHLALRRIRKLAPDVKIGLLFQDRILEPWQYAENTNLEPYSLHPRYTFVDEEFVKESHEAGFKVYPWTVDDPEDLQRLLDYGVDGVFTNNPDIFGSHNEGK